MEKAYRELKKKNEALLLENAEQRRQNAALTEQITKLSLLVAHGNERLGELLAIAQRKTRGAPSGPRPPAPPAPVTLDEDARKAYENRPIATPRKKKPKAEKKPRKPTGRKPLPDHLVADEYERRPDACKGCGRDDFEWVDQIVETKLHVVKEHQRKRVVRRKTGCCKHCGIRTTARSLPSPFSRSKATCEWIAWLLHQKFVMLTPLDRLRRDLKLKGIPLAMSYLVSQVERAADMLGGVDGEHWKQLLAGDWMATDATGIKVLVPDVGSHHGHMEVYRRDDIAVFQYEASKGSEALVSKLAPFKGVLVADAEHRHNAVFTDGTVLEAGCNAHGRRKFRDAEAVQPALAAEGGDFVANIYVVENEAQSKKLAGDALRDWRRERISPLRDDLLAWMNSVEPTLLPDDPLAKVVRYYRNHWDALFRFIEHPEIPIDNSGSEREFQNFAKLRLNSLFAGSSEGAHRAATLLGIAATCRAIGVDTQSYLAWALTRLGTDRDLFNLTAADLTPAAYLRAKA